MGGGQIRFKNVDSFFPLVYLQDDQISLCAFFITTQTLMFWHWYTRITNEGHNFLSHYTKKYTFSHTSCNTRLLSSDFLFILSTDIGMSLQKIKDIQHSLFFFSVGAKRSRGPLTNQIYFNYGVNKRWRARRRVIIRHNCLLLLLTSENVLVCESIHLR
jgi:hypothetical protein